MMTHHRPDCGIIGLGGLAAALGVSEGRVLELAASAPLPFSINADDGFHIPRRDVPAWAAHARPIRHHKRRRAAGGIRRTGAP
jgi:hypothetical protein